MAAAEQVNKDHGNNGAKKEEKKEEKKDTSADDKARADLRA